MESESICDFLSLSVSATSGEESRDQAAMTLSRGGGGGPTVVPAVAEVSPGGEGPSSPPNNPQQEEEEEEEPDGDDADAVGFGPPPAFPNSNSKLRAGKRKRTLMAVSSTRAAVATAKGTTGGGTSTLLDDVSSDEEDIEEGRLEKGYNGSSGNNIMKRKQPQMIHRIKNTTAPSSSTSTSSPHKLNHDKTKGDDEEEEENDDGAKSYIDAMLLASLSDVDCSPKRLEEFANAAASTKNKSSSSDITVDNVPHNSHVSGETSNSSQAATTKTTILEIATDSPKATIHIDTASTAPTPLRSNVNLVKPYALMPKPNKRGKLASATALASSSTAAASSPPHPHAHWQDVRDPQADKLNKNERGSVREETVYAGPYSLPPSPPQPQSSSASSSQYPMGYHPGYPYPYPFPPQASAAPLSSDAAAVGFPAYPPQPLSGSPSSIPYAHFPQGLQYGASSSPYHYHPPSTRRYYPVGGGHPVVGSPDRWDQYPPQPPLSSSTTTTTTVQDSNKQTAGWAPEVHFTNTTSRTIRNKSHVVPSEDGEQEPPVGSIPEGGVVHGPYNGGVVGPPPPPGYPYAMYHGPSTRDGRYPLGPPPPHDYKTVSGDDGSPPRTGHPGECYNMAVNTPPRGGGVGGGRYEYLHDQSPQHAVPVAVPGSYHGAYPPPPPPQTTLPRGGYHPESPMTSMYPQHHNNIHPPAPPYGAAPPPSQFAHPHDSYDPYNYHALNSPSLSAIDRHPHDVSAVVSSEADCVRVSGGMVLDAKTHQFRKGGRSIHSAPVILRKKFSWRNYAELEEYLIANRAEYLRHSALNYTAEQKHFNNQLTEGLLELAAKLNYVFDETCFNFVTVRDRIRCYFKSYVQSSKKRGVVVGFSNKMHPHNGDPGCSE